jgi:hypothetical protein
MRSIVCLFCLLAATAVAAAQGRGTVKPVPPSELRTLDVPDEPFTIAVPRRDWSALLGMGSSPVMLVQKSAEAHIVVERARLNQPLTASDITELFVKLEGDLVRERQPGAKDINAVFVENSIGRVVMVEFMRTGLSGPEKVRQYSIPAGRDLIRVQCAAPLARFPRYDAMCTAIGLSVRIKE